MSTSRSKEPSGLEPDTDLLPKYTTGKINVIEISDNASISQLGIEEREQLFDKLSKDNKLLPKELFMTFRGIHEAHVPTLPEALLRVIINESAAFQATGTDHLVPHTNMLVLPILAYQSTISPNGSSSAIHSDGVIRVAFDVPTRALAPDGSLRNISAKTSVAITGVVIQGCESVAAPGYIPRGDTISSGRVRGIVPTGADGTGRDDIGLGAAQRCSSRLTHPSISPGSYVTIDGMPVKLPHQFDFSAIPTEKITQLLQGILSWVRWVGESSYRQTILAYHDFATVARGEQTSHALPYKLTPTVCPEDMAMFDTLGYFETGCAFNQTTRLQLRSLGLERAYDAMLISGRSAAAPYINTWKNAKTIEQWEHNAADKVITEKLIIKTYAQIIAKKFGNDRGKKFADDVRKMRGQSIQAIMQKTMKPSEISVVATEYKRLQEYLEAVVNNKCPHLRAIRTFRRAISDEEISAAYNALKGYFSKTSSADRYIECNKCGFGIICPHKRLLIELDLNRSPTSAVKAAISQYIGSSGPGASLFCKVCGETLTGLDALESYEAPRISHNDELAQFMWGEIAPIMRHFRFGPQINVSQLITTIRDACYQYIFDIEKRLIRSKTSSTQEILAKKKLYIDIYGFAYMILLINKNPGGQIEFRGDINAKTGGDSSVDGEMRDSPEISGGAGGRQQVGRNQPVRGAIANKAAGSKASLVDLIKGVTSTIVVSRNVIIREIRGMTPETIRNTLIDAYKILSAQTTNAAITTSDINEDIASDVLLGVVYETFYRASVFADLIHNKRAPKSEFDIVARLTDILGGRLDQLCKKNTDEPCSIFTHAKKPHWNIKQPSTTSLWVGNVPLYKSAANWCYARGFELFAARVINMIYRESIWQPIDIHRLDDYSPVKYTGKIYKYNEEVREFNEIADIIDRSRLLWSCQLYKSIGENKRRHIPAVGLDRLYGADGHLHKWDKMIIGDQTVAEGDFIEAVNKGVPLQARNRSDMVCSICSAKRSSTGKNTHDVKINDVLRKQVETTNFYRFYENRCPSEGNHDWSDKSPACSRCGLVRGQQSSEYYDKWQSNYIEEKTEMNNIISTTKAAIAATIPPKKIDWTFDYNLITKFAELFEVRPKIIMALGIPEIVDWNTITAGTWTPPVIEIRNHPRVFALRGMISNLTRDYNKLRMFKRIFKVPQSMITLIESAGINRTDMNSISEKLPEMPAFDKDFAAVYATLTPAEIIEWLLEKLCESCIWATEQTGEPVKTLMDKFIREYVGEMVRSEELTSKPGYFNWSLLYGDSLNADDSKATDKPFKDSADDDESTPFSMDAYDMETGDADDDATTNHAGDELGM